MDETMTEREEQSTAGGSGDSELLTRLLDTLHRLPGEQQALSMSGTHWDAIRTGLDCRGDPFAKEDVLVLTDQNGIELRIPVSELPGSCGRGTDADHIIEDARASRVHFHLRVDGPFVLLEDAGTTNGTMLNGRRIALPEYLAEGDKIVVGRTEMTVGRG